MFATIDGTGDLHRQPAALLEIDVHAEEVLPGLGQDLRQARGGDRIVPRDDVGPSAALEEHDRLDEVRLEAAVVDRVLDERAEGLGALGGREHAAGTLRIERVAEPERGCLLELLRPVSRRMRARRSRRGGGRARDEDGRTSR